MGWLVYGRLFRELLVLLPAHLDGGEYVWRQHVPIALRLGATGQMIDAIKRGDRSSDAFGADKRSLLALGRQVIRGGIMDDATFDAARRCHSDRELVEAILAIGHYMTMNRLTSATQTPPEITEVDPPSRTAPSLDDRPENTNLAPAGAGGTFDRQGTLGDGDLD